MAVQGVARRYAEAVFELASTAGTQDAWLRALRAFAEAATDEATRAYFVNPAISNDDKDAALRIVVPGEENREARNLVRLLIRRQRFSHLPGILEAFEGMLLSARGIAVADVTTAVELTEPERRHVGAQLARVVGSQVEVRSRVDDAIVGGLMARIGDQLIDGSVRTQLRELRASLGRR
jgi:F-type H+-transporting ATPase subunit delta